MPELRSGPPAEAGPKERPGRRKRLQHLAVGFRYGCFAGGAGSTWSGMVKLSPLNSPLVKSTLAA
jgi:hypothetical protein